MCDTAAHLSAGWLALGEKKKTSTPLGGYVCVVLTVIVRDRLLSTERNNDSNSSNSHSGSEREGVYAEGLLRLREALGDEVFAQHEERKK